MFPEEIITILKKYQSDNTEIIDDINISIGNIKSSLQEINKVIADKTHYLMTEENVDNHEDELIEDSKVLRKYMNSIQFIDIWKDNNSEVSEESIMPTFEKMVYVFLLSEDLCPFCNMKLIRHIIHYQRIINNKLKLPTPIRCVEP